VYAASKTEGEREAWNWVKKTQPGFVLNTVLPNMNVRLPHRVAQATANRENAYSLDESFPPKSQDRQWAGRETFCLATVLS